MKDWYDNIEPEIRPIVKLLRDNGWNTTCSCGHKMYVELGLQNMDDTERLATFLLENGHHRFRMEATLQVFRDGYWSRRVSVHFNEFAEVLSSSECTNEMMNYARHFDMCPKLRSPKAGCICGFDDAKKSFGMPVEGQ